MNLKIVPVGVNYINQIWPHVRQYVDDALTKGHDFPDWASSYNTDHVLQFLASGQWMLIVAIDEEAKIHGACTVSFLTYPLHRVAFITTIGGKLISNDETFKQLTAILKANGATKIQGYGRDAIVRLWKRYNFEPRNTLVEVLI